jgi:hypothetical protein
VTLSATPFARGSVTSEQAARAIRESATPLCRLVLDMVKACGIHGATRDELEVHCNLKGNTLRPRVKTLLDAGLVVISDEVRRTASGRPAEVLVAKGFADVANPLMVPVGGGDASGVNSDQVKTGWPS